jgi:hypothetical protein
MNRGTPSWHQGVWAGLTALTALASSPARADDMWDFLSQGRVILDTRYRFENVAQHGFSHSADANTIRERLGYESASFWDLKALVEIQATQHLSNGFNDTINGRISYPQIPDPEALELNRLQLSYAGVPDVTATLGRQVINLDDQRFIGASAFRQNEQTFDAARIDYKGLPNFTATYAYINRVNRVFGDRSPAGHFGGNIHLFNIGYDIAGYGKLTSYAYLLDLDNSPALSTATYGVQFGGAHPLNDQLGLHYTAGYARQTDYAANPRHFALDYWRLEGGFDYASWSLTGGSETLGGNGVVGFSTPLATLHAFQGDADAFLNTPAQGIADRYVKLGYQTGFDILDAPRKLTVTAWYHDYNAAHGSGILGHELDFDAIVRINDQWRLDAAYAAYDGTASFARRDKTWLSLTFSY